ncbi:MAG: hypothetical protein AMJ78_05825 [Omnitrophica WOR_2 bacterium SM23_29]|nr:MAG: hypothetical protein AMJ78_05825 [Omnitrophica WOR_2 bacterium SM23_29]
MRRIRIIYAVAFISIIIAKTTLAASPIKTEHFRVVGFGGEVPEANLERIAKDLESAYICVANFLDINPYRHSKIEVRVFLKPKAGEAIRASASASCINLDADFNNIPLLRHELTHILIKKSMSNAPRWFHEGVAEYMEWGDIRKVKGPSEKAMKDFSFVRLEADFGADLTEGKAYYYSWSIISFLIDEYGKEKLQRLFKESGFLKDRFRKAYGIELKAIEEKADEIFTEYKPKGH